MHDARSSHALIHSVSQPALSGRASVLPAPASARPAPASARPAPASARRGDGARRAVALLGRIAPGWTAAWAARKLLTPVPLPLRREEQQALASARRGSIRFGRHTLTTYTWDGPGDAVLLVHGWGGHAGQMAAFASRLRAAGHRVVAYDAPCHGASGRGLTHVPELAEAVLCVGKAVGPLFAAIGHSAGAASITMAAAEGLSVGRAALIAPAIRARDWAGALARSLGFDAALERRFCARVDALVGVPLDEIDVTRFAPRFRVPTLVAHDPRDPISPWAGAQQTAALLPLGTLMPCAGLGHYRILRDPSVCDRVLAHVTDA